MSAPEGGAYIALWRWVVGVVGAVVFVGGLVLAFVLFSSGGRAAGLFGPAGLAALGLIAAIVAWDGEL